MRQNSKRTWKNIRMSYNSKAKLIKLQAKPCPIGAPPPMGALIGKKIFNTKTKTIIATIKAITAAGLIINLLLYSESYLISPPKTPGI